MNTFRKKYTIVVPEYCEREEKLSVSLYIDKDVILSDIEKKAVEELLIVTGGKRYTSFYKGDTADIKYNINITYDSILKILNNILILLDNKSIVKKVDTKELIYNKCVAQELFCKLEQLEQKFK